MEKRKKEAKAPQITIEGSDTYLDSVWKESPDLIRQFLEHKPDYEQLCTEVAYILGKRLKDFQVEISTVSSRAKTLNSFLEKAQRKKYKTPFEDIHDFAGIRIVYLYKKDAVKIEEIIHKEFDVIEKIDKLDEKGIDRFGYLANHFIAKLNSKSSGARYEDLKHFVFEIQVRTVLQDAWAIIDHHLAYKRESDVPRHLQRRLTSIAGMFEIVDDVFNDIEQKINEYTADLRELSKGNSKDFLKSPLDLDSFKAYLLWRFNELPIDTEFKSEVTFENIDTSKYKSLSDLDKVVQFTESDIEEAQKLMHEEYNLDLDSSFVVLLALGIVDESIRKRFAEKWQSFLNKRAITNVSVAEG